MTTVHHGTTDPRTETGCRGCGGGHGTARATGGCGCDPSEACALQCLERPLFSAGMVLSDSDLTALVDWTTDRLGLQRLRHGWGVVCGLDVRCDPDAPGRVVVEPGYAVGCCGEDVVVCEEQKVDLTECCLVESPCDEPDRVEDADGADSHLVGTDAGKLDPHNPDAGSACGDVVVDVVLTPLESLSVTGLVSGCGCGCGCGGAGSGGGGGSDGCGDGGSGGGGGCGGRCGGGGGCGGCGGGPGGCSGGHGDRGGGSAGGCGDQRVVPTRARQGGSVCVVKVSFPDSDPVTDAARRALADYAHCHKVVRDYLSVGGRTARTRDQIVDWFRTQHLDPPCGWWDDLCADLDAATNEGDEDGLDAAVARALFDLVVDCRHRALRRRCAGCTTESVPLARVWLRRVESRSGQSCVVTHVDAYPPYRRELRRTTAAMPAGAEDLAPFIWQRWDQVCSSWRRLAPEAQQITVEVPGTTQDLLDLLDDTVNLWWPCETLAPTPVVVRTECLGERVLGFRWGRDKWIGTDDHMSAVAGAAVLGDAVEAASDISDDEELVGVAIVEEPAAEEPPAEDSPAEDVSAEASSVAGESAEPEASATETASAEAADANVLAAGGDDGGVAEPAPDETDAQQAEDEKAPPSPVLDLESVRGLGPGTADKLRAVGITTVEELVLTDPRVLAVIIAPNRNARAIHAAALRLVGTLP